MILIFDILAILFISFVFVRLAHKFNFSEVIGLIVAGLFLSIPFFREIFISRQAELVASLSTLGLFTLMLVSGFEISRSMLKKEEKDSLVLTSITILVSLSLGFFVFFALGFSVATSLVMGICFSVTAEATKARSLLQLKEIKTRLGALLLEAGILNDIFGVIAFSLIIYFFASGSFSGEIAIVFGMILAFLMGVIIHIFFNRESRGVKFLEKVLLHTVVPFFFINMALNFSSEIFSFSLWLFLLVFFVSSLSQILGAYVSKFFINLSTKQAILVGVGMNSKGAVELAIAFVAFRAGLLSTGLYSALVATSLISTVVFHLVAYGIMKKYPKIMN